MFNFFCKAPTWKCHVAVYATLSKCISTDSLTRTYLLTVTAQNKEEMDLRVSHRRSLALQTCMQTMTRRPPAGATAGCATEPGTRAQQWELVPCRLWDSLPPRKEEAPFGFLLLRTLELFSVRNLYLVHFKGIQPQDSPLPFWICYATSSCYDSLFWRSWLPLN